MTDGYRKKARCGVWRLFCVAFAMAALGILVAPERGFAEEVDPTFDGMSAKESALATEVTVQTEYSLGPGDQVRVTVFGQEDLSGEFSVSGNGKISLPLIGEVEAGGLTIPIIEQAIVAKLKPDYLVNPRVSIEVLNFRPFFIIGEVNNPGSYPYQHGMTVVNAIALAGGYTYRARENRVLLKRAGAPSSVKETRADENTPVLPGDVIRVPERFF